MNSRSGIVIFFLFLFLAVLVLLQVLSMVQSDRLYERLNQVDANLRNLSYAAPAESEASGGATAEGLAASATAYPGDEGDWLVWRLGAEPATLNPIVTLRDMSTSWIAEGNIFEGLLEYDLDTVTLRPVLAESFGVSDDGMELEFVLREGACFSDGVPVTTDDVVFTFETIRNPLIDAASLANYFADFKEVVKTSERGFKVLMKQPYFKALEMFGGMPILPQHVYAYDDPAAFNRHHSDPVGSGPYIFEKWNKGQQIVLRRNERYYGKKPNLLKIVYPFIINDTAALQSLQAGQVDFMRPLPEQYAELSKDAEFSGKFKCLSYWNPGAGYFYIGWNQASDFFKDRRVRLAMTHMIDRPTIVKHLLRGDARVPTGPFYIFSPQNDGDIEPWPFDLARARALLDETGWVDHDEDGVRDKDGVPFRFKYMIVSGTSFHEQIVKLVKDAAAKVGVDIIPDPYEWSVFIDRVQNRQFEAVNLAWGGAVESDPYQIWHSSQIGNHGSNYVGFNMAAADALIEAARGTLDGDKRNAMYRQFHRMLHEEQPYTFVYTRPSQRFLHPRFKNVIVHKLGLDGREWYVPRELQRYQ